MDIMTESTGPDEPGPGAGPAERPDVTSLSRSAVTDVTGGSGTKRTELTGQTVGQVRCENPFMVAEDVNVYYGDNHAIRNVTLEVGTNQVVALIGPSGCGKSTLLKHMIGLRDPAAGQVLYSGKDFAASSEREKKALLRKFGVRPIPAKP